MSPRQNHLSHSLYCAAQLIAFFSLLTLIKAKPLPYAAPAPLAAPWPQTQNTGSGYGDGPTGLNVAGGASGTDGGGASFDLSTGAIVAICVVSGIVVILGVMSTVLFYIAKKRQWQVRRSISRASRRVTAKVTGKKVLTREEEERRARRHGAARLAQGQSRSARHTEKRKTMEMQKARLAQINARNDSSSSAEEMKSLREKDTPRAHDNAAAVRGERKIGVVLPPV